MNEHFSDKDYNQLGIDASNLFVSNKENTLMDAVIKVASENNLSLEGVERLAEKANQFTQTSILKHASDKKMEFKVVDPKLAALRYSNIAIKDKLNKEASYIVDNHLGSNIPDFVKQASNNISDKTFIEMVMTKQATYDEANNTTDNIGQLYNNLKKERNQLKAKVDAISLDKMASYFKMEQIVDDIISEYNHVYAEPFTKLAYDAYNMYGEEIYPFLEGVANTIRHPLTVNFKKEASDYSNVIDDTTSDMCKLASYINAQRTFFKSTENINKHKERIEQINNEIGKIAKGVCHAL